MGHPAETAYLSFRDRELSNDVWLVEFRQRKVVVHTFLRVAPGHCLHAGFMESRNFFVLRPIWVKFHIRTRLIESFPTTYWLWWCAEEKLHFTPVHTLRQLKRDEALFPPLPKSLADRNGLKNLPRQFFLCVREVWWQSLQRCRNSITKPVRTCPQYSDHVHCLRNALFLHFRMLLFFSIMFYPAEIAYFNSPN